MLEKKDIMQCLEHAIVCAVDYRNGWNDAVDAMPRWISVEERLPENEIPVLVSAKRNGPYGKEYQIVFTAFYTDGTTHTEDSGFVWYNDDCADLKYCEDTDDYIIPQGWWEDVRYGEEFSRIWDDTNITHWMSLPKR